QRDAARGNAFSGMATHVPGQDEGLAETPGGSAKRCWRPAVSGGPEAGTTPRPLASFAPRRWPETDRPDEGLAKKPDDSTKQCCRPVFSGVRYPKYEAFSPSPASPGSKKCPEPGEDCPQKAGMTGGFWVEAKQRT
ncbi:hypothetical protein, partial [Desulfolutivibrio sp.]|uniref:hypothetical protein n=1 Tax=Desulfolutivibrio sp. TaxID=2773296 RepID=UPI002F968C1C